MKLLATFLPQFHECQYNNKWWGKGFTEWNNVKEAKPIFSGHYQPKMPLYGEFDLSSKAELISQSLLAKNNLIDGFSIYHYWYNGERPLGSIVDTILSDPEIDLNFSLYWANHPWTRSWRNKIGSLDVLISQDYHDKYQHFNFLLKCFSDKRYIFIDDRPLFNIYVPEDIPHLPTFIDDMRKFFLENLGVNPYLVGSIRRPIDFNLYSSIFDSILITQPTFSLGFNHSVLSKKYISYSKIRSFLLSLPKQVKPIIYYIQDLMPHNPKFVDYDLAQENAHLINKFFLNNFNNTLIMSFVDFDNTARYGNRATILTNFTSDSFYRSFSRDYLSSLNSENKIHFINSWNEWGEGMYLQPCFRSNNLNIVKHVVSSYK